jgi:hypothetical protein
MQRNRLVYGIYFWSFIGILNLLPKKFSHLNRSIWCSISQSNHFSHSRLFIPNSLINLVLQILHESINWNFSFSINFCDTLHALIDLLVTFN